MLKRSLLFLWITITMLSGCTADKSADDIYDPYEQTNRDLYDFNMIIEREGIRPVVKGYNKVVPNTYTTAFVEFFSNLEEPVTFLNNLLQADFSGGAETVARFTINSTLGFFGLFDVADGVGLKRDRKVFGHTFGVWGIGSGPYLVPPFYRPISTREAVGKVFDTVANPLSYTLLAGATTAESVALTAGDIFTFYADNVEILEQLETASVDPYATFRSLYYQRTYAKINDITQTDKLKEARDKLKESGQPVEAVPATYNVEMEFDDDDEDE